MPLKLDWRFGISEKALRESKSIMTVVLQRGHVENGKNTKLCRNNC